MLGAGARGTVLGLALAVGLGTGACAGDGEPATLPTLTPSESDSGTASGSPSSSSSEPASPKAEVEAAVRAFYEALERAVDTGDTSGVINMSTAECDCRDVVTHVKEKFADGRLEDADIEIESVEVKSLAGAVATTRVRYFRSAYREVDRDGRTEKRIDPLRAVVLVNTLRGRDGRWRVVAVDTVRRVTL